MKKRNLIYIIATLLVIVIGICTSNNLPSYAVTETSNIKFIEEKIISESLYKEFEVIINNKKHKVSLSGIKRGKNTDEDIYKEIQLNLLFDNNEIRELSLYNTDLDFNKLDECYDLNEANFYFIKGADSRTYLGIRFGVTLTILNETGKVLKHKPEDQEFDYFSYVENIPLESLFREENYQYQNEQGEDIVEKYFYEDEIFSKNSLLNKTTKGRASVKIENNKIYAFIINPHQFHDPDSYIYLYENEYVISNNEIYYKELNKYKINPISSY